jgi:hypothetical protein
VRVPCRVVTFVAEVQGRKHDVWLLSGCWVVCIMCQGIWVAALRSRKMVYAPSTFSCSPAGCALWDVHAQLEGLLASRCGSAASATFLHSSGHMEFGVSLPSPHALASRMEPSNRDARESLSLSMRGYPGICLRAGDSHVQQFGLLLESNHLTV